MMNVLAILGGLGVFLVGLRMLSNGLQKLAGPRLRGILGSLTRNRFAGVLSGFVLTCAVQSSSATTVLVVSFANAGLLNLLQAIGLVMGANIGTTLTAWIVSLLGFKVKISAFALPIIGIGFPLSLMKGDRNKQISEVMVGFGLLFLGLDFLKSGVPDLKSSPETFEFLQHLTGYGFGSILLFVLVGTVLTIVVQSSSASSAITLTLVAKGWIGLDLAAAMILGENLGTTITAQLAAIGANRNAKRVATFHTLFNVIGIIWMLPLMGVALALIRDVITGDPLTSTLVATTQVALFHTMFNVTNTALLIWFTPQLERLVLWFVPRRDDEGEIAHLQFLESGLMGTPELATLEAQRALQRMVDVCDGMLINLKEVIPNPEKDLGDLVDKIKRGEQITDDMEEEITNFCSMLARSGTSAEVGHDVATYLDMANDIERIGDHCMNLVLLAERRKRKGYVFSDEAREELLKMMDAVEGLLKFAHTALDPDHQLALTDPRLLEKKVNKLRNSSRKLHARRMQEGEVEVRQGLIFLDMMTNLEKIGDYAWNVIQASHINRERRARI